MPRFILYMENREFGTRDDESGLRSLVRNAVRSPDRPDDRPPSLQLVDHAENRDRPDLLERHLPFDWSL